MELSSRPRLGLVEMALAPSCCFGKLCISTGSGQGASAGLSDLSEGTEQETAGVGTSRSW